MLDYLRTHILPLKPVQLLLQTGLKWQRDHCSNMAASLSYYALFSLFPIVLVMLSVLGALLGPDTDMLRSLQEVVQRFLPPEVHGLVSNTVQSLNQSSTGAGLIGFSLLMYSASTVFGVLNYSVDQIWQGDRAAESNSLKQSVFAYLISKLTAFVLVFGVALLLLCSLISNLILRGTVSAIETFGDNWPQLRVEEWQLANNLQIGSSFLFLALVYLVLLKILPSARVAWRDLWPGAMLTAGLMVALQRLVSTSVISIGSRYLSYGVVGSVMILLLWIYLTCQIFFVGCEFTYVYSCLFGSRRDRA